MCRSPFWGTGGREGEREGGGAIVGLHTGWEMTLCLVLHKPLFRKPVSYASLRSFHSVIVIGTCLGEPILHVYMFWSVIGCIDQLKLKLPSLLHHAMCPAIVIMTVGQNVAGNFGGSWGQQRCWSMTLPTTKGYRLPSCDLAMAYHYFMVCDLIVRLLHTKPVLFDALLGSVHNHAISIGLTTHN